MDVTDTALRNATSAMHNRDIENTRVYVHARVPATAAAVYSCHAVRD